MANELIDRVFRDNPDPDTANYFPNHQWAAGVWFTATGRYTKDQLIAEFEITVTEEVQLDQLIAHYQGLSNQAKHDFYADVESAGVMAEQGRMTRTKYKSIFGLT